ncbi:MAG: hypothetical protein LBR89_02220 [Holosporales bacterium]|jgi:16S rRNA U516 pseudouridylate synthase RsuA-like enzyme|nr:hypothetical protein [Holosporales bacterium]
MEEKMRIAKYLAHKNLCSRREAERRIAQGDVLVNGQRIDTPAFFVDDNDVVLFQGEKVAPPQPPTLWLYYKPTGEITTHSDPQHRKTVFDSVAEQYELPRVISVGRLDINSEGLLLLTNSSPFAHELETQHAERVYHIRVFGTVNMQMLRKYASLMRGPEEGARTEPANQGARTKSTGEGANKTDGAHSDRMSTPYNKTDGATFDKKEAPDIVLRNVVIAGIRYAPIYLRFGPRMDATRAITANKLGHEAIRAIAANKLEHDATRAIATNKFEHEATQTFCNNKRDDKFFEDLFPTARNFWIQVTIFEGKNRELRKVMNLLGLQVNRLIRIKYGPYELGAMHPGELRRVANVHLPIKTI